MGLIADALSTTTTGCVIAQKAASLKPDDRADFDAYCEVLVTTAGSGRRHGPPSVAELSALMRQLGVIVGRDRLGDHVFGRCACGQHR